MNLTIGQRLPLNQLNLDVTAPIIITFSGQSSIEMDISCFALDSAGKLIHDDYMIFYNQPVSPCGNIKLINYQMPPSQGNSAKAQFEIQLSNLPNQVDRLYFVLSADSALNQISSLTMTVVQQQPYAQANYQSIDFANLQACMLIQLYRKNGIWRLANVAQGFNGGLAKVIQHFGGDVENEATEPLPIDATAKVSLEKVILDNAPKLVNLAKKATVSLEKRQLQQLTAKVALVLDATGSMNRQYKDGHVQEVINRLLPLAVSFDDDQALDCWAFGERAVYLGEVGLNNYADFITTAKGGWRNWPLGARVNNEALVMKKAVEFYKKEGLNVPIYVLFISDGGVHDARGITDIMTKAAKLPIFWQFLGLSGRNYGVLKKLDEMTGRVVDNCSFFEVDELDDISEQGLYDAMLNEFPSWLITAKQANILP